MQIVSPKEHLSDKSTSINSFGPLTNSKAPGANSSTHRVIREKQFVFSKLIRAIFLAPFYLFSRSTASSTRPTQPSKDSPVHSRLMKRAEYDLRDRRNEGWSRVSTAGRADSARSAKQSPFKSKSKTANQK